MRRHYHNPYGMQKLGYNPRARNIITTMGIIATAAIAGVIASTATGVTQMAQASKSEKRAKSAAEEQSAKQREMEAQLYGRQQTDESESNAIKTRDAAKQRQRNLAVGSGGMQDTILTGPLGVAGEVAGAKKTLLGA